MKPGDVVAFRAGLHGIEAPRNLAILLERRRRKGVVWVRLWTLEGEREMKAEHVLRRAFRQRYDGRLDDEDALRARLRMLVGLHAGGTLEEQAADDVDVVLAALWDATAGRGEAPADGVWSEEALARALYEDPSPVQRRQVKAALDLSRTPGLGPFETVGRGDAWRPWTSDERQAMQRAWAALGELRARLVRVEDTDEGRAFVRLDLPDWTDDEQATLAWMRAAMAQYVEHDGDLARAAAEGGVAGIGGFGCVQAWDMDLHRTLGFLASDWIASGHTTRSSDYVHFLLESGLWGPDDAVDALVRRHVNQEPFFSHREDAAAEGLAAALPEPDLADDPGREDMRRLECYTIDPPDAKDFDDAVGLEPMDEGRTRLWIHIADVSHYVAEGSRLDRHARDRATSVYLPGRVLPMLPHRIADHLCSLRSDGDRFALSAALTIDAAGDVVDARFHRGVIRVRENLSYEEALRRARAGTSPFADLLALAQRMRSRRRGLDLDTGETRVQVERDGFLATQKRGDDATRMIETFMVAANEAVARHLDAAGVPLPFRCHPLPDAAKTERARHQFETMGFDVDLAVPKDAAQALPDEAQSLLDRLRAGGGSVTLFGGIGTPAGDPREAKGPLGEDAQRPDGATPADDATPAADAVRGFAQLDAAEQGAWLAPFSAAVAALQKSPDAGLAEVATWKLLSCMGQAFYTPRNLGHFGLASEAYCHFTSPIRRYPDLIVHRNLKWLLDSGGTPEAQAGAAGVARPAATADARSGTGHEPPHDAAALVALADHCSDQERRAQGLERTIRSACLVLASLHGDTAFDATAARITGMTPTRVFLVAGGLDASTAMRDLPGGPYEVDEWESMLFVSQETARARFGPDAATLAAWSDDETGEARAVRGRLGDRVTVRLAGRDVAAGRTDAVVQAWTGHRGAHDGQGVAPSDE